MVRYIYRTMPFSEVHLGVAFIVAVAIGTFSGKKWLGPKCTECPAAPSCAVCPKCLSYADYLSKIKPYPALLTSKEADGGNAYYVKIWPLGGGKTLADVWDVGNRIVEVLPELTHYVGYENVTGDNPNTVRFIMKEGIPKPRPGNATVYIASKALQKI